MMKMKQKNDSKTYNRRKLLIAILQIAILLGVLFLLIFGRLTFAIGELARRLSSDPYVIFLAYACIVALIERILTAPLGFYSGFILEHRFRLSNQSLPQWIWEQIKASMIGLAISSPLLLIFYFFLHNFEQWWWLPVALVLFLVSVVLARLAPILIFPLFYKFSPLEDSPLRKRLLELARKVGLMTEQVFSFNLSKTTQKANAGFTGLGKSRRIILSDTLLQGFPDEEIATIFAHELGHYRYGHLWKGIVIGFAVIFLSLFATARLYEFSLGAFGFRQIDQVEALPLLALYLLLFGLLTTPLQNSVSRKFERQADTFAVELTGKPKAFISALEKIAQRNLADKDPHPVIEFLFYSHPSIKKRIRAIEHLDSK